MRQEPLRLELGELAAHRRRGHIQARALEQRSRAHRFSGLDVILDDAAENRPLALAEIRWSRLPFHLQGF